MKYQIKIQGSIDPSWSEWFDELEVCSGSGDEESGIAILSGDISDQATLRGILNKLWDLNLTLLSVIQIEAQDEQTG